MLPLFWAFPLPLCSCAVIPSAVTLRKSGVKTGPTSSFLISTPETGVDSIMVTYAMMDFPMTIMRPLAAFISASTAGLFQFFFNDFEYKETETVKLAAATNQKLVRNQSSKVLALNLKKAVRFGFVDLLDDISNWLFVGILLGACIDFFIPVDLFLELDEFWAKLAILFVGIPMYVCASATTPIAAALMAKGLLLGRHLYFCW